MTALNELVAEATRHAEEKRRLVTILQDTVRGLPDNTRIRRFRGNPHCFVASWSDLGDNWQAEHHDSKAQYEQIARELEHADDPVAKLLAILTEGKVMFKQTEGAKGFPVKLHPEVIQHLCNAFSIRWKTVAEWPEGSLPVIDDHSEDLHLTKEAAEGVRTLLRSQGFGGDRKLFPKTVRVEATQE